ncbi:hypothetical protein B0H11DRAFT_1934902 [Mycena galericulata]|nr:hypothetical protein B0H11DRAFT_1934902 [Mycena galericulata]
MSDITGDHFCSLSKMSIPSAVSIDQTERTSVEESVQRGTSSSIGPSNLAKLYDMAATLPEDIERVINEVLLNDTRDMCGTMSLVASRFHAWTKPIMFHTVIIRRQNNWMQQISDCLLPNASLMRILVLNLPFTQGRARVQPPGEELSFIRQLLEAAGQVRHLAVTWNIWALLQRECGALRIENLYLIWDGALKINRPSLYDLRHPAALQDLTVYAPSNIRDMGMYRPAEYYLPAISQCDNLAYVTYASDRIPYAGVTSHHLKGAMLILVGWTEQRAEDSKSEIHPPFSAPVCMQYMNQVLEEWVAKMEGRESLLSHAAEGVAVGNE